MVAIVIMMVGMLGLLKSINVAMEFNLKNHLRDEAVYVGEKYMNIQRGRAFDLLTSAHTIAYEPSKVRGSVKPYTVELDITPLSGDAVTPSKLLEVVVKWTYKGVEYRNRVTSPVSLNR